MTILVLTWPGRLCSCFCWCGRETERGGQGGVMVVLGGRGGTDLKLARRRMRKSGPHGVFGVYTSV